MQPRHVVVDAGATWKNVLDATLKQGLTPPVLTNYLGLSIGGTLAVSGIGGSSSRYGMQTDNVLELDVVTGDGKELTCSATSNPDIFAGVLAGVGQCAIITRATLGLVLAPERCPPVSTVLPEPERTHGGPATRVDPRTLRPVARGYPPRSLRRMAIPA